MSLDWCLEFYCVYHCAPSRYVSRLSSVNCCLESYCFDVSSLTVFPVPGPGRPVHRPTPFPGPPWPVTHDAHAIIGKIHVYNKNTKLSPNKINKRKQSPNKINEPKHFECLQHEQKLFSSFLKTSMCSLRIWLRFSSETVFNAFRRKGDKGGLTEGISNNLWPFTIETEDVPWTISICSLSIRPRFSSKTVFNVYRRRSNTGIIPSNLWPFAIWTQDVSWVISTCSLRIRPRFSSKTVFNFSRRSGNKGEVFERIRNDLWT